MDSASYDIWAECFMTILWVGYAPVSLVGDVSWVVIVLLFSGYRCISGIDDLEDSGGLLRKVWIGVEGSIGPYY